MSEKKIVSARITDMPKTMGDPMPEVFVKLEGEDQEQRLFQYYPDELFFEPKEFVGLTLEQARRLKSDKDQEYLTDDSIPAAQGRPRTR